jgi:hypothetical protein
MENEGAKEAAGLFLAQAAVREAEAGNSAKADELIAQALAHTQDQSVTILSGFVASRAGKVEKAHAIADKLDQENPANTFVQKYWLPTIRAESDLQSRKANDAVAALAVYEPFDLSTPPEFYKGTLYPAYVRGQAYLAAGDGPKSRPRISENSRSSRNRSQLSAGRSRPLGTRPRRSAESRFRQGSPGLRSVFRALERCRS